MRANDCPKWPGCSCPVCPLDFSPRHRHLAGDRVCLWLRELVKPGGRDTLRRALGDDAAQTIEAVAPAIMARWSDVRHKLAQASLQGSKRARCLGERSP
jgi:hypothetical protein